jgi:hypothetical protein
LLSRKQLTWAACDALAAQGIKPTIALVREWTIEHGSGKKGSNGDVQQDIHEWFDSLLEAKQNLKIPGLPDPVADCMRQIWRMAVDEADASLSKEREEMEERLAAVKLEAQKQVELAQQEALEATAVAQDLKSQLAIEKQAGASKDEIIKRLEADLAEIRATLQAKDIRIEGLNADLTRVAKEHAAGLAELDGLRKHTLMQIEEARGESRRWKAEFDRVDAENKSSVVTYRQRAAALENELSGLRGRLSAIEEALATSEQRCRGLEKELAERQPAVVAKPRANRFGMVGIRLGTAKVRRNKL